MQLLLVWCSVPGRGRGRKRTRTDSAAMPAETPPKLHASITHSAVKDSPRKATSHGMQ